MTLNEQQRAKLDDLVSRMEAGGESETDIRTAVDDFKSRNEQPAAEAPGALGALGAAGRVAQPVVEAGLRGAGELLGKASSIPKVLGGALGAHFGASATAQVGMPFAGAAAGGVQGARIGKKLKAPIQAAGRVLEGAGGRALPLAEYVGMGTLARGAVGAGRIGSKVLGRVAPGVGDAMMAYDAYNLYKYLRDPANKDDIASKRAAMIDALSKAQ